MKPFRVAEIITSTKIILNCGSDQGISLWDKFEIFGLTKLLKDPETNEELGQAELIRGKGQVTHIQNKLCIIESVLKDEGNRRIIRKNNPFGLGQTTEEEITSEPRMKNFDNVQIGDYARKV